MVPVDLVHADSIGKALGVAAGLSRQFDAKLYLVGVTGTAPSEVAHSPGEYREKLEQYAKERSDAFGVKFETLTLESHDAAIDLDKQLQNAAADLDADLIVMASHVPHFSDWLKHSHASWLAAHTDRSIFIVR